MTEAERRALAALVARLLGADAAVDPTALPVALVRRHLLAPLAHRAGAAALRGDFIASALQAERRAAALTEAVAALADAAVPVILLKGVAYAGSIYPDPAERPMSDIDLLVPSADFDRAARTLGRLGYWHAGGPAQLTVTRHAVTFKRRDAAVDLHRHILHAGRSRIDLAAIWSAARPSHVAGALRPQPIHEYLLHLAHIGRHEGAVPLINYVDAHRLSATLPPAAVADVHGLARAWTNARAVLAIEAALDRLADRSAPAPDGLRFPTTRELLAFEPAPRWVQVVRKLCMIDDWRGVAGLATATARSRLAPRWRRRAREM
ncbi:MAG TPA: nucleotidyltransferase family protein [Kofleriaceae bacterium]|nr:nucleotidyltransferase family protein [Kofleriaceae bacterium]